MNRCSCRCIGIAYMQAHKSEWVFVCARARMRVKFIILMMKRRNETYHRNQTMGCQKDYLVSIVLLVVPAGGTRNKSIVVMPFFGVARSLMENGKKKEEEERMNKRGREKQAYARVTVVPKYLQRFLILISILVCNWFSIRNITVCFSLPFSLFFSGWDWSYNGGNSNNNIYVKKRWRHTIHMHTHSNRKRKTKSKIESCAIIELFLNKINRARDQIRLLPQYIYNTIIGISSNSSSYSIRQRFNALKSSAAYQFRNTKTHSHTPRKKRRKVKRRVNSLSLYLALFWHAGQ